MATTMASTRTRLAELSRTIETRELGRRIRNARIAAGMTQTDLAGDDVSSAYVSRIEDGQRRPGHQDQPVILSF